jgi:hypothetical protein
MRVLINAQDLALIVREALGEVESARFQTPAIGAAVRAQFAEDAAQALVALREAPTVGPGDSVAKQVRKACMTYSAPCVGLQ